MRIAAVPAVRSPTDQACIWMLAGVLGYKLCDHGFDCEHCPLDAALRGDPLAAIGVHACAERAPARASFPADRLYSSGHTWIAPGAGGEPRAIRLGIDCFAASLLGPARRVRRTGDGGMLHTGGTVCELDFDEGVVPIGSPVAGSVRTWNDLLRDSPEVMATDPYERGWIVELWIGEGERFETLASGPEALTRARLDARHFWRGAALHLASETDRVVQLAPERLCAITDLRRALGRATFIALARDIVH